MSKDPAFLFYPGDYLRDTQCLSEKAQVSYDRIMCEHMRNICISKKQLKFFTKRLSEDELEELMMLLVVKGDGYQIEWVSESITKRKAYSDSRRKNRSNSKKTYDKDMLTYDEHMENENISEDVTVVKVKKKRFTKPTVVEIREFCLERKSSIDPEYFYHFNEAKGWLVGKSKTPMKSWKSTIITWEKNNKNNIKEEVDCIEARRDFL